MIPELVLGTRGSDLALWQANYISSVLQERTGCRVKIEIIKTSGDRIDHLSFDKMEGKGFFTKELEDALSNGTIDLAVHSLKDLMTTQPDDLTVGAVGFRADRRELLLVRPDSYREGSVLPVKPGGVIGTSSARRQAQIVSLNAELTIADLRGNVPTRVRKLREGQYDAIIVAKAGVDRLKLELGDLQAIPLESDLFLPAPAQGILGIQIRRDDSRTAGLVGSLHSKSAELEAKLERGLLAKFEAGCSLPLGVFSQIDGDSLRLRAVLGKRFDGYWVGLRGVDVSGSDPDELVEKAFAQLSVQVQNGVRR